MKANVLKALRFLYLNDCVYKNDFMNYFVNDCRPDRTYTRLKQQMYNALGSEGIKEKDIDYQGAKRITGQTNTIVYLTPEGIEYYKQYETDDYYQKLKIYSRKEKRIRLYETKQVQEKLWPHLNDCKVRIMYDCIEHKVNSHDKPSLLLLSYYLLNNPSKLSREEILNQTSHYFDKDFLDIYTSRDEIEKELKHFLKEGIYYSKAEVRFYLKKINKNITDTFKSVNWNGIFVSNKNMYINFILPYGINVRAKNSNTELKNLILNLQRYIVPMTNVVRKVPIITELSKSQNRYENKIDAISIGQGNSHTYSECVGKKFGRNKSSGTKKRKYVRTNANVYDMLDCHSRNFDRIYSISDNKIGIDMLTYLTYLTLEDYHQEENDLFYEDDRFKLSKNSTLFPYVYIPLNIPAIYLPVYEIKLMNKISNVFRKYNRALIVITKKEMFETISHCLRLSSYGQDENGYNLPSLYFCSLDTKLNKQTGEQEILIGKLYDPVSGLYSVYDEDGYIKGKRMLDNYLLSLRKVKLKSEKEYGTLAKTARRSLTGIELSEFVIKNKLFNQIALAKNPDNLLRQLEAYMNPNEKAGEATVVEVKPKERKKFTRNSSQLQISLSGETKRLLSSTASSYSLSSSSLIRKVMNSFLDDVKKIDAYYDFTDSGTNALEQTLEVYKEAIARNIQKK